VALCVLATSCSVSSWRSDSATRPATSPPERSVARAELYAQVVRRLVLVDHGYGTGRTPYRVVYILDGAVRRASDPLAPVGSQRPSEAFPGSVKAEIRRALRGGPRIVFVDSRADVIVGRQPGQVDHRGVLITLGPIRWRPDGRHALIPSSRYTSGLNGQWGTYRAVRRGERWSVTGLGGRLAIS
jgi:hypothetical protein